MPKTFHTTRAALPAAVADGTAVDARADEYGALHVRNELMAWAQEGSYFKATTPTIGTGVGQGIQTSFSATANVLLLLRNGSASRRIIPHYIRLINTVAGASTTQSRLAITMDTANRYSTGGTDCTGTIACANSGIGPASGVDVLRFGGVTASAAVAPRTMANAGVKAAAAPNWVVGDEVRIMFSDDADAGAMSGTAASRFVVNVGPLILGGQNHCMLVHLWNIANATTAPSWELEMAWWER